MMQASIASPPLTARPLRCRSCGAESAPAPAAICGQCLGPLDPVYDPERALPDRETIAGRAPSLWRYREWLPFDGEPTLSLDTRSEEHTSELQSLAYLVCRLLLEKKNVIVANAFINQCCIDDLPR